MEFCELLGNSNNSAPPALAADLQLVEEGFKGAAGGIRPFTHHPLSFTFLTTSIGGGGGMCWRGCAGSRGLREGLQEGLRTITQTLSWPYGHLFSPSLPSAPLQH